jgi:hypothetical protein
LAPPIIPWRHQFQITPFPQSYALKVRRDAVAHALDGAGLAHADLNMDNSGDEGKYLSVIGPYLAAHNEMAVQVRCKSGGAAPAVNSSYATLLTA